MSFSCGCWIQSNHFYLLTLQFMNIRSLDKMAIKIQEERLRSARMSALSRQEALQDLLDLLPQRLNDSLVVFSVRIPVDRLPNVIC
jgi:hypothetical protein